MKVTSVEEYINSHKTWSSSLRRLREIILSTGLDETIKWSAPVYTYKGKNIVGLGAFKSYCGMWFFQGALLKDESQVLINAQEGKTNALRQWRFSSIDEIEPELIKAYVIEAIHNQEAGKEIKPLRNKPLIIPDELSKVLDAKPALNEKFKTLSLSKKREFADYISEAKREATKLSRLEKIIPMIESGVGLHDKYRNC